MAFVTSYERSAPGGIRVRVLCCYHLANPASDDPNQNHTVHYAARREEKLPGVDELWAKHGWGRRGKQLPVCPRHRLESDADWIEQTP
jgi:hypothetical protein